MVARMTSDAVVLKAVCIVLCINHAQSHFVTSLAPFHARVAKLWPFERGFRSLSTYHVGQVRRNLHRRRVCSVERALRPSCHPVPSHR